MKLDIQLLVESTQDTFKELFLKTVFCALRESSGEKNGISQMMTWENKKNSEDTFLYSNIE